jgi:hypothetical protein
LAGLDETSCRLAWNEGRANHEGTKDKKKGLMLSGQVRRELLE